MVTKGRLLETTALFFIIKITIVISDASIKLHHRHFRCKYQITLSSLRHFRCSITSFQMQHYVISDADVDSLLFIFNVLHCG